ncbi:MAG TPA: cellulase family glycosylhydrolase, partial [Gammaproteobacteria bacterium]|nr:cellulase family glycosylhydrolase [Gammaproteobacteria bacterium]
MFKITLFISSILLNIISFSVLAQMGAPVAHLGLANNSDYYLVLSGVDHKTGSCSDECYAVLGPKKGSAANQMSQQWVDLWSTSDWIYVGYSVCQNVSYSETGAAVCQGYLGHVGATLTPPKNAKWCVDEGGRVNMTTAHGNTLFMAEFIADTPIEPIIVPDPVLYPIVPFRGNNIAAAEFSSPNIDWIIQDGFPNKEELAYFAQYGMNTYRIPIRWSYAQPTLLGPLNQAYVSQLVASSTLYLEAGFNVIVDLHSYMRFQADSTIEPNHAGKVVNAQELTDIWDKLSD